MVAGAVICSCSKESVEPSLITKGEVVTMRASLPDDFTRVSLTDESTYMDLKWERKDTIAVIGNTTCEYFTIEAYDSKASVFKGVKPKGTAYDVIIPGGKDAYSSVSEVLARSYDGQTQTGDASTAHLKYNVWLTGVDDCENVTFSEAWAAEHGGEFHTNGVLKLYCKMPEGAKTLTKIVIKAPNAIFYSTNEATSQVDNISLGLKDVEIPSDARIVTAYIMTSANDVIVPAGTSLTVDMTIDQRVYSKEIVLSATEDKVLKAGRVSVIKLNDQSWDIPLGTLSNPYKLSTTDDLLAMNSHMVKDDTTYFKLMNDIDMSSVSASDWTPVLVDLNHFIVFDGQNHKISNFTAKGAEGFFKYVVGTVKDVTFDNAVGVNCILADYIGSVDGTRPGIVDNVTVRATLKPSATCAGAMAGNISKNSKIVNCKNCELTIAATDKHYVGGLVGRVADGASNTLIDNCSVTVDITSTAGEGRVGGIVGANNYRSGASTAQSDITISNCTVSGKISATKYYAGGVIGRGTELMTISNCTSSVDVSGANHVGGIVGAIEDGGTASKKTTISSCTSSGTITGTSDNVGGIAGYGKYGSFYSCSSSAAVSSNGKYVGGIVGQLPGSSSRSYISKCAFTGSVTATGSGSENVGGIAGSIKYTILEQSYSTATVSNAYRMTGGLAGEATSVSIVLDCWSSGEISVGSAGRLAGGIVGYAPSGLTIENCYSTASIEAPYVIGGILGVAGFMTQAAGKNVSVSNCVAWNPTIECSKSEQSFSSGAVTGYMAADLSAKDCYRRSGMSFTDTRVEWTLFDMDNTSSTAGYALVNPDTSNEHYPYHGKAAASDATVSSLAQTLGWNPEIWDFSASLPVLKWTE